MSLLAQDKMICALSWNKKPFSRKTIGERKEYSGQGKINKTKKRKCGYMFGEIR